MIEEENGARLNGGHAAHSVGPFCANLRVVHEWITCANVQLCVCVREIETGKERERELTRFLMKGCNVDDARWRQDA